MFLGTSRIWWILTAVVFVLGLAFVSSDLGGDFGTPVGVLLVLLAMMLFAAAPRKRREAPTPPPENVAAATTTSSLPPLPPEPPRPRPAIEGRDPSEV